MVPVNFDCQSRSKTISSWLTGSCGHSPQRDTKSLCGSAELFKVYCRRSLTSHPGFGSACTKLIKKQNSNCFSLFLSRSNKCVGMFGALPLQTTQHPSAHPVCPLLDQKKITGQDSIIMESSGSTDVSTDLKDEPE